MLPKQHTKTCQNGAIMFVLLIVVSRISFIALEALISPSERTRIAPGLGPREESTNKLGGPKVHSMQSSPAVSAEAITISKGPSKVKVDPRRSKLFPNLMWTASRVYGADNWMKSGISKDWDSIKINSPVDKEMVPPSGDKRDFTSIVVYSWPCDKLPPQCVNYGRRKYESPCKPPEWRICDGHFNVEGMRYSGYVDFGIFCKELEMAAAEYKLRKTFPAGAAAVRFIRSWFINSSTAMHPRLLYSQTIPYSTNPHRKVGSNDSVIDWWLMPNVLDSVSAVQDLLTEVEKNAMYNWTLKFFKFISQDSVRDLHNRHPSNHGPWYDAVYYSICVWLGDYDACRSQAPWTMEKLDRMVDSNGNMPHETGRKSSVYYYIYTLDSFSICAALLSRAGVDLWGYVHAKGASMRTMYEYITPHIGNNFSKWPHVSSTDYRVHQLERALLLAAQTDLRPNNMTQAELISIAKLVRKPFSSNYLICPELFFADVATNA